jgi:hypothetical protein
MSDKWAATHRAERAAYMRARRAADPEHFREVHRAWADAHHEERRIYMNKWYAEHREERRAYTKALYQRPEIREKDRAAHRAYHHAHKAERAAYSREYRRSHHDEILARNRARREVPWVWARISPWPSECQVCGLWIDPAWKGRTPLAGTVGHEPPIAWMVRHPEYDGPLVLRPEHWSCNLAKNDRPDWERA